MRAKNEHLKTLEQICLQCGVAALYAFGGPAKEVSRWFTGQRLRLESSLSDVDIGVKAMDDVT